MMQPGYGPPMGNQADDMAQMKAELAAMKREQQELKEQVGYQDLSKKLTGMQGAFVKQKIDLLQVLTGCQRNNKFEVYDMQNGERTGKAQFIWREQSGCYSRMCLPGDCRPLDMYVDNIQYGNQQDQVVLHINRPCKCTFYCFNRQEMQLSWIENGQQKYLGKIVDPWTLCNFVFKIYDEEDKEIYHVEASCCQLGFQCKGCPYDACQKIIFNIKEPNTDNVLGQLVKTGRGYCVNMLDWGFDNFKIDFPKGSNWKQRALLITCAVFVDFMLFMRNDRKGPTAV